MGSRIAIGPAGPDPVTACHSSLPGPRIASANRECRVGSVGPVPRSANNPLSTIALRSRWSVRRFAPEELLLHRRAVVLGELLPLPGLGGEHEVHDVARQEAERAVVVLGAPLAVAARRRIAPGRRHLADAGRVSGAGVGAVLEQRALDGFLEGAL